MGLFDNVICEVPIETVEKPETIAWQTKSFGRSMDSYRIRADGQLILEGGPLSGGEVEPTEFPFTGFFNFYTVEQGELEDVWLDVIAAFEKGRMTSIKAFRKPLHKRR